MPLTGAERIKLAEITGESIAAVAEKTPDSLDADLVAYLREEIPVWDENRNAVDFEMAGETKLRAQNLLDAIRERVRLLLDFPSLKTMTSRGSCSVQTIGIY